MQVVCDVGAVAAFCRELRAYTTATEAECDRVLQAWGQLRTEGWSDARAVRFEEELTRVVQAIASAIGTLGAKTAALQAVVSRGEDYLGQGSMVGSLPVHTAASAQSRQSVGGRVGRSVRADDGAVLELWDFSRVSSDSLDWGADADFPRRFAQDVHHGLSAADYRAFVAAVPAVLNAEQTGSPPRFAADSLHSRVREVLFGTAERIRLEIGPSGRVSVGTGRHRIMAAIEQGVTLPVEVVPYGR